MTDERRRTIEGAVDEAIETSPKRDHDQLGQWVIPSRQRFKEGTSEREHMLRFYGFRAARCGRAFHPVQKISKGSGSVSLPNVGGRSNEHQNRQLCVVGQPDGAGFRGHPNWMGGCVSTA